MKADILRFVASLENERNASTHTIRAYSKDLSQLYDFAQQRLGHEPRAIEIDLWLLRAFFAEIHARRSSAATAGRKLATYRSFFRFLCREGALTKKPCAHPSRPQERPTDPDLPSGRRDNRSSNIF